MGFGKKIIHNLAHDMVANNNNYHVGFLWQDIKWAMPLPS